MIDVWLSNPCFWYYSCCKNPRNKNIFTTIKTWGGVTVYSSLSGNNMIIIENWYSKKITGKKDTEIADCWLAGLMEFDKNMIDVFEINSHFSILVCNHMYTLPH